MWWPTGSGRGFAHEMAVWWHELLHRDTFVRAEACKSNYLHRKKVVAKESGETKQTADYRDSIVRYKHRLTTKEELNDMRYWFWLPDTFGWHPDSGLTAHNALMSWNHWNTQSSVISDTGSSMSLQEQTAHQAAKNTATVQLLAEKERRWFSTTWW